MSIIEGTDDIPKSRKSRGIANYKLEHILDYINKGSKKLM